MYKKINILVFLAIIPLLSVSCQPTPETEYISNIDQLEEKIAAPPVEAAPYQAPSHWKDNWVSNQLEVIMDATVELPDRDTFPITKVKKKYTTDSVMWDFIRYFAKDAIVYKGEKIYTQVELQEEIIRTRAGISRFGYHTFEEAKSLGAENLEQHLALAPETVEEIPMREGEGLPYSCHYQMPNGEYMEVARDENAILFTPGTYWYGAQAETDVRNGDAIIGEPADVEINHFTMTEKDAIIKAKSTLDGLGITEMRLTNIELGRVVNSLNAALYCEGWHLTFHPENEGLGTTQVKGSSFNPQELPTYVSPFPVEQIIMLLNENGVHWLYWKGLSEKAVTINENVKLLPFDEIQECIKNLVNTTFGWNEAAAPATYRIDSISLMSALIPAKDEPDAALYVPAWFITGAIQFKNRTESYTEELVVNAITGSRIEQIGLPTI